MTARAPGKVVLSGAYAVLEGAPALVTAVDRYVVADANRPAAFITPEVEAAVGRDRACYFDASALRDNDKKLGLGSSAAILVATMAALGEKEGLDNRSDAALAARIFEHARAAHRKAQGGGSGIDVAASTYGGNLVTQRAGDTLKIRPVALPPVHIEVWAAGTPASTAALIATVRAFAQADPRRYELIIGALFDAATRAESAVLDGNGEGMLDALGAQLSGLTELGTAAKAPIVTDDVAELARAAKREHAVILPAGAGGGDIVIFAGRRAPSPDLSRVAADHSHYRLPLRLGARGVHLDEPE